MIKNITRCKNCQKTYYKKYRSVEFIFSDDFCPKCNSNLCKTLILNSIFNPVVVSDYIYSTLINYTYGENTVEVPDIKSDKDDKLNT